MLSRKRRVQSPVAVPWKKWGDRLTHEQSNGAVGERSSYEESDIQVHRVGALRTMCEEVGADVFELRRRERAEEAGKMEPPEEGAYP